MKITSQLYLMILELLLVNLAVHVSTINYLFKRVDFMELQEMIEFVIHATVKNWVMNTIICLKITERNLFLLSITKT